MIFGVKMELLTRILIAVSACFLLSHDVAALTNINPGMLTNTKTGAKFTDILVEKLITDVTDIAKAKVKPYFKYKANDLAAVQAIRAIDASLFELSAFFAVNKTGYNYKKYLSGVAIEYATTRCDSVASNRFPRSTAKLPSPWTNTKDHLYYYVDCRRNASDISSNKFKTLHAEIRVKRSLESFGKKESKKIKLIGPERKKRKKRALSGPSICGSQTVFGGLTGNMTSPGYPGNYTTHINCVWHIKVPVKYAISLTFDMFDFEHDKRCLFDSVEFFDGPSVNSKSVGRFCGTSKPVGVRSSLNVLTIRMKTDDTIERTGFSLRWNYTEPMLPHPGFLVTSNIVVDQIGPTQNDLKKFTFVFNKPTTCPLKSKNVYCYFQYDAVIISRIISTTTLPSINMKGRFIDVVFEHVIDLKVFPTLYKAKKFCMTWNDTIPATENGAWTRYGGNIYHTDIFSTTCRFEKPGIYAVIAEHNFTMESESFRFTGSFYAGIFFSVVWLVVLMGQWGFSRRINVPEWLNFNQAVALLLFIGVILSGLHLHFEKMMCALLAFLLYFFGLSVFFWQFLKAAQISGKFDEFFAKGRNIYLFYFLLGWTIPLFISGMAAGATFFPRESSQSCWLALVGGTIWGYTSPTYFLVFANLIILYKVSKKTKKNLRRFNHPELRKRVYRDLLQLLLFVLTWVFGILCALNKTTFYLQYVFCVSITLSVLLMSLGAKQRRPGYQRIHYLDPIEKEKENKNEKKQKEQEKDDDGNNIFVTQTMSMKAYKKWKRFKKYELKLGKSLPALRKKDSDQYQLYPSLDEESQVSLRSARSGSSVRSESALSSMKDDENSEPESELQMSSDDDDGTSHRSVGSTVEVRADVIVDGNEEPGNEEQEQEEYQNQEDGMQSQAENQSQIFDGDGNAGEDTGEQEEEAVEEESNSPDNNDETQPNTEDNQEQPYGEGAPNSEGGDENNERSETSASRHDEEADSNGGSPEQEEDPDIPVVTVNAFGGTPIDDGSENPIPQGSSLPSRAVSARPPEDDVISVCSLGDEDDADNNDDEDAQNVDKDLYDVSMFQQ